MRHLVRHPTKRIITYDIRNYLRTFDGLSQYAYSNALKALKAFFRDFMKAGYLVESFRFPSIVYNPIIVPNKEELQIFYKNLETAEDRALFLLYATSGLRRSEVLSLLVCDVARARISELEVQDRYIDSFCDRVPRSILARHYTDYSPQRLKRIYDKAGLTVLS